MQQQQQIRQMKKITLDRKPKESMVMSSDEAILLRGS